MLRGKYQSRSYMGGPAHQLDQHQEGVIEISSQGELA
jgi:hypothetical protein